MYLPLVITAFDRLFMYPNVSFYKVTHPHYSQGVLFIVVYVNFI